MVWNTERAKLGITITIRAYRKHGNGAVGSGRKNSTGKIAVVTKAGEDPVRVTASTRTELMQKLRRQWCIPSGVVINEKGVTEI
jgi:hypothetical protein